MRKIRMDKDESIKKEVSIFEIKKKKPKIIFIYMYLSLYLA